jgi:hypothetical protein
MSTLAMIIPTVLGVGIALSIAVILRDAYERLRGPGWMSRRCGRQGQGAAVDAVAGAAPGGVAGDPGRVGLRSRSWYLVAGTVLMVVSIWLLIGSWGNYVGWRSWLESIAWLFVLFLVASGVAGVLGVSCLLVAIREQGHPLWIRPLLDRTPLGRPPRLRSVGTTVVEHPRHSRRASRPTRVRPLGPHHITDMRAVTARTIAGLWTVVAVALVGWMTFTGRVPTTPEELDTAIATPAWVVLYLALVVAAVAVYRWELAGSVALAVCAGLLGVLSSIQYPTWIAFALVFIFAVPAFLHWLAWQREHHVHHLFAVGAWTAVAVASVVLSAGAVQAHFFGPTHPESDAPALEESPVEWAWAGATTSRSTEVVARVREEGAVRLLVSDSPELVDPVVSEPRHIGETDPRVVRLRVDGLDPRTRYHWALEVDGRVDLGRSGTLRTLPEGPASFTLVAAACARSGSNGAVFDAIREVDPLVYLQLGDLHYANIGTDEPDRFEAALQQVLTMPAQAALYRSTSIAYVWDDHDYAANDGDSTSPSRPAAEQVYRSWVPYHPLVSGEPEGPIGQSFVAGRVRVVMTDSRSQRTPPGASGGSAQQILGTEQELWFAEQLALAREAGEVVLWAGSTPWIGEPTDGGDTWAGYPAARRRMADLIVDAQMQDRLVMVAGDAHMVALDDGSHTDYSTSQAGGFPLLQAAALDRPGSVKGGPYSGGTFPGGGRYGEIVVSDDGGTTLDITLRGSTWDGELLVEETFTLPAGTTAG